MAAQTLIQALEEKGLHAEAGQLRDTQEAITALQRPPGLMSELTENLKERARRQWALIVGEVQETGELIEIINKRLLNGEKLSQEEREQAREQLLDIMKMVPAGLIATASALSPIPLTLVLTPVVLRKLGLLPSRWKEAHVLETLKEQARRLEKLGEQDEARQLESLAAEVAAQADAREVTQSATQLLSHWDSSGQGSLQPEDQNAYDFTAQTLRELRKSDKTRRVWYFQLDSEIFGPLPLVEVERHQSENPSLLVCHQRTLKWVKLIDIMG